VSTPINCKIVVPTWFMVGGLVALSSPQPLATAGIVLIGLVVVASAVIFACALRSRLNAPWPIGVQRTWHTADDRRALDEATANDVMRMDSDKG
jgi:hypothetical protein